MTLFGAMFTMQFPACQHIVNRRSREVSRMVHTEKSFRNLDKSNRNQIVFTIFRLIWKQTDFRLDTNQS